LGVFCGRFGKLQRQMDFILWYRRFQNCCCGEI